MKAMKYTKEQIIAALKGGKPAPRSSISAVSTG